MTKPTQADFDKERLQKENDQIPFTDITTPSGAEIRVFKDGFAFGMNKLGGKYTKYFNLQIWDFECEALLPQSHADKQWEPLNKQIDDAWSSLQ